MSDYQKKEKVTGIYLPAAEQVSFNREWGTIHRFTDEEVEKLLAGEEIKFAAKSRAGKDYTAKGKLAKQEFERDGNVFPFWGFKLSEDSVPDYWCGHQFTDEEKEILSNNGNVYLQDCTSKGGKSFACTVKWDMKDGRKKIIPDFPSK